MIIRMCISPLFCQEGMVKMIVAGEALVASYDSQGPHLEPLLRVAFDPARQGDTRPDLTGSKPWGEMDMSENSVPLNPTVNDYYPY